MLSEIFEFDRSGSIKFSASHVSEVKTG